VAAIDRDAHLPGLANSVNNLAIRLAEAGRRTDALAATQEAVKLYRELAAINRDAHLPDLAMSVTNLARRLTETGRRTEALAAAREAAQLYREAQHIHGEVYGDDVSRAEQLAATLADLDVEPDDVTGPAGP
jgi:tetratricopeptide (TPR) repeat protein